MRLDAATVDLIQSTAVGALPYRATLARKPDGIDVSCTCPYVEESHRGCKHVWAAILAAESTGHPQDWCADDRLTIAASAAPPAPGTHVFLPWSSSPARRPEEDRPAPPPARARALFPIVEEAFFRAADRMPAAEGPCKPLWYSVDVAQTASVGDLVVRLAVRDRKKDGTWGRIKAATMARDRIPSLPEGEDRRIVSLLFGAPRDDETIPGLPAAARDSFRVPHELAVPLLESVCATGRCLLALSGEEADSTPLAWDGESPFVFHLAVAGAEGGGVQVGGTLRRDGKAVDLSEPLLLLRGGAVLFRDRAARLDDGGAWAWIQALRRTGPVPVAPQDRGRIVGEILAMPSVPRLDLPEDMRFEETVGVPRCRLEIRSPSGGRRTGRSLRAALSFDYEGTLFAREDPRAGVHLPERRLFVRRDPAAERDAETALGGVGCVFRAPAYWEERGHWVLSPRDLPRVVRDLASRGWQVEAEGKLYRHAAGFSVNVSSGIDWLDLEGTVSFGGVEIALPRLLKDLRAGEGTVVLDDGTVGILPEEWLERYALLAGLGRAEGKALRFAKSQAGFLDAMLAAVPEVHWDESAAAAREELVRFRSVEPEDPSPGFRGTLRPYQREGLGWMRFLRAFSFGGCLADDMGLGKTVQVLAMLEARRAETEGDADRRPSLVVVPRSLVFNWRLEAERFTPRLRILEHMGTGRGRAASAFDGYDAVITTYGTLRRDAVLFQSALFDYAVLDETQAIKNRDSDTAKAARLLAARHRLGLSGTPVENHIGELWSLFEFLNPGMLGSARMTAVGGGLRDPDEATRRMLSRVLRPFLLRRTKEQVAPELPPKSEQIMYCELEDAQREQYEELRRFYQASLLEQGKAGAERPRNLMIVEALLRLRQVALHPGLLDEARAGEPSAKLDMLLPRLEEVVAEGHKALVFSQFTSFLAIVRERLDRMGIRYEYLDGRTRDRQARVEAFQTDPDLPLFLISLKAGGMGLNLTAADYVFLLDPWWNPAVEAQAIDRTHRIGQDKQVFAYRLIARDTVEERVQALQQSKKDLAASLIGPDNGLVGDLTREDLEILLS